MIAAATYPQPAPPPAHFVTATASRPSPPASLVWPRPTARDLRLAWALDIFADWLPLYERDVRQLQKHLGWSPEDSLRMGVRSVPSAVVALVLCSELRQFVGDGDAWPAGFYVEPSSGALRFDCEKSYGLIIPVWRRWPVALQLYGHAQDSRPTWITSASREIGAAAVASIHAAPVAEDPDSVELVFLVEHTLRAMAVAARHGVSAAGLNGASASAVPAQLFEAFPRLRGLVTALPDVPPRLERELAEAGLSVRRWEGGELL
jgi:hypothetical protein